MPRWNTIFYIYFVRILGFLEWPNVARLVRGNVLYVKETDYIKAGVVLGVKTGRLLFTHILHPQGL